MQAVPNSILERYVKDGAVLPKFSGMGKFRNRGSLYTKAEETVLDYFFTNTDSNVYAVKDTLPNELWALLMGQYARSNMTAKDRLLKLFSDMHEKDENLPSIDHLAHLFSSRKNLDVVLEKHIEKAGKFIEEWGINYGHASLRDSAYIRMCFEGVSQRVTKILEAASQGAYQEQSTRALPFTIENIGIPFEIRETQLEKNMLRFNEKLMSVYKTLEVKVLNYLQKEYAHLRFEADKQIADALGTNNKKLSDRDWNAIISGKTFDIIRYLLPQNMTTSLGLTLNTRLFQDELTRWQSHPLWEMQILGKVAQIEAMKVNPTLMKYGNRSGFQEKVHENMKNMSQLYLDQRQKPYEEIEVSSDLISHTQDIENVVLANMLFVHNNNAMSFRQVQEAVKKLTEEEKRKIIAQQLQDKPDHEPYDKALAIGSIIFERCYDIGGFRDLQRQRGVKHQYAPYQIEGFSIPKEIKAIGEQKIFIELLNDVQKLYKEFEESGYHHAKEYVALMANTIRHVVTTDLAQIFYEQKLRTKPEVIDSCRAIEQKEALHIKAIAPEFFPYIKANFNEYPLNRIPETVNGIIRKEMSKK